MYTYVTEFNLAARGIEANEYILDSVRTWPELWGGIKGVTGTLLLGNAFALRMEKTEAGLRPRFALIRCFLISLRRFCRIGGQALAVLVHPAHKVTYYTRT